MDVRDAVTDQQNEPKCVSTIIGHLIGGVRLGFEGLHGLMGCSQGYINRVWRCSLEYIVIHCGGKKFDSNSIDACQSPFYHLYRCDGHDIGGWEGVNSPYRAWDGVHLINGIHVVTCPITLRGSITWLSNWQFLHISRGVNVGVHGARGG